MTECTGAKRKIEMSKRVQAAYKLRHGIENGYYNYGVRAMPDERQWDRYRNWVNEWIETCRAARGLGRGMK